MKINSFIIYSTAVLILVVNYGYSQDVNFSNKKQAASQTSSKKTVKNNKDKNVKSKNFKEDTGIRAASTCHNCECQCDSYQWKDARGRWIGNCKTEDTTGAKFCYISGRALRVCRDKQQSKYRQDSNNGRKKWYSYEACSTPTRRECYRLNTQYNQNCGDGDYNNGGGNNGGYPNNNNGGYPNNNNGGYPNNNNGGYPNNNNGGYPNNNNGGYPNNNNGGYPNNNNGGYPNNNNGGYPNNNNGGYPNNNNGGYPNNNNGGYPNNNNGGYPNNNNGGYPNNNNGGYPNNNNGGYPNNNQNQGYPSNNGNSWTLQSQIPGLGSPRSDKKKDTSITFGQK